VHEAAGRWAEAVADYGRALELPGADRAELIGRRARCQAELDGTAAGGPGGAAGRPDLAGAR
ncbi:hypothetical protein QLR68_31600, partial [Micromonospora sp. DH15]|nr:hypothetical protein [Micromonospora sp. DH15]